MSLENNLLDPRARYGHGTPFDDSTGYKLLNFLRRVMATLSFSGASVTATDGDLIASKAGKGVSIKEGANARMGAATLVAGTVTVATTAVATGDRIFLTRATTGGTVGHLSYTISNGVSFTINSTSNTETSTINWEIVKPAA